jgi:hypothetical protein
MLSQFLKLTVLREQGELSEEEEGEYAGLQPICEREADPEAVEGFERRRAAGERLSLEEAIAYDTALRRARPPTRPPARLRRPEEGRGPRARRILPARPRGSRVARRTRAQARSPGRLDDPAEPEPPPWRIYEHAARAADPRISAWLESWADEIIEAVA